jgi:hypothetical protein
MDTPTTPLTVHLYVDGTFSKAYAASGKRVDVARAFPAAGDAHGIYAQQSLAPGPHTVCLYAINTGQGASNPGLGCGAVTVQAAAWNPIGAITGVAVAGRTVSVAGWALDADSATSPSRVHVYVDGRTVMGLVAGTDRADVGRAFPWAGRNHGFYGSMTLAPGKHTLCVYGINVGNGSGNPNLGCKAVSV